MFPRTVSLKDGTPATLRRVALRDAPAIRDLQRALVEDGRGMVLSPDEVRPLSAIEEQTRWWLDHPDSIQLTLEHSGVLIGSADLRRVGPRGLRHNAALTMGVHPGHQGRGAGAALMAGLMDFAVGNGIDYIELYTLADNTRAQALYRKHGFSTVLTRRGFLRRPDGRVVDDIMMSWYAR